MAKLYRPLQVLMILILVILGLNMSNQGINSLTMEARKPIIGLQTQGDNVKVFTLGETHSYNKQAMRTDILVIWQEVKTSAHAASNYLLRIVRILKVLLFA